MSKLQPNKQIKKNIRHKLNYKTKSQQSNKMDTTILQDIGLSNTEIKVFLKLLETGESKTGKIIEQTNLQSSSVYNALAALIKKGLVSYISKGQIKYYKAANPEIILNFIESKKQEFEKILPELKIRQKKQEDAGAEYFKSYKGIKALIFELFSDAKEKDIYRFIGVQPEFYKISVDKVYRAEKEIRNEKKVITKGIFPAQIKELTKKKSSTSKRYLSWQLPPNTLILNDKVAIISWEGNEPTGILIRSKDIYQTYVKFFEHLWTMSEE